MKKKKISRSRKVKNIKIVLSVLDLVVMENRDFSYLLKYK